MKNLMFVLVTFSMLSLSAQNRTVLIEEFGGTWCGHCPAASVTAEHLMSENENVIEVALHYSDVFSFTSGNSIVTTFTESFPSSAVDRFKFDSQNAIDVFYADWESLIEERLTMSSPCNVSAVNGFNPETREMYVTITATFLEDYQGDLRFNCYVVEDSITGSGSSYYQSNYYNDSSIAYFPELYGAGSPITNYTFRNVARHLMDGSWGTSGIIPNEVSAGESYSVTYEYTLPQGIDSDQTSLVFFVHEHASNVNNREILNAGKVSLEEDLTASMDESILDEIHLYPNPANEVFYLSLGSQTATINIYNALGGLVYTELGLLSDSPIQVSNYTSGIYWVEVIVEGKAKRIKLLI